MYCIQETDKPNFVFKMFNIVQLSDNKIILPIGTNETLSDKKAVKMVKKTKKVLDKTISKKVVISQEIQKQAKYTQLLENYDLEIVNGKWLFEVLSCQVLDYILQQRQLSKKELSISILVNKFTENIIEIVKKIATQFKRVNIITNHVENFKKIQEQMLNQDGIVVTVGNNKKKGLAKSQIILNIDFPSNLLNQYSIYDDAIVINVEGGVVINKKRFNGITINDYDIVYRDFNGDFCGYEKNPKYKACEMYEAQMNKSQTFNEIMKQIKADKVEISKLIGKNDVY